MKKTFAAISLMLASPLVFGHPGHVHDGFYSELVHLALALATSLAAAGAGLLIVRLLKSATKSRRKM
jgi:hypothetical protein